jgi:hypothetical protein
MYGTSLLLLYLASLYIHIYIYISFVSVLLLYQKSDFFRNGVRSSRFVDILESVAYVLSEESEVGLEEGNCVTDDFDFIVALLTTFRVVDVFLIAISESLIVLALFLFAADFGVSLFSLGSADAFVEGVDLGLELIDFGSELASLVVELVECGGVLFKPVLIITTLDFARFGNLGKEFVAEVNDSLDEGLVSLDGGGSGDLGEEVEDLVPRLALEDGLGVLGEVGRDLCHNFAGFLLEEA